MSKDSGNKPPKDSCVIYCRVSTKDQAETMSLSSQERYCRDFAKTENLKVDKVFIEAGKSGRTSDRPELQTLMQYCVKNQDRIKAVVMYKLDRLMRNNFEYYKIVTAFMMLDIEVRFATQPMIDKTPEGNLLGGMYTSFAEFEARMIGRRAQDGMHSARLRGLLTNAPPIGYKSVRINPDSERGEIIADPERAPFVTEAFKQYAGGVFSMAQIARHLTLMGYTSPRSAKSFTQQNLCRMLRNRTYTGYVKVSDEEGWVKGVHPPLIDEETFEKVQRRLEEESRVEMPRTVENSAFPLRGFMRCPRCGRHLTASFSTGKCGKKYPYYRCLGKGCGLGSIRKDRIEAEFVDLLENVVPSRERFGEIRKLLLDLHRERQRNVKSELAAIERDITELESKVTKLHEAFIFEGKVDKELYDRMLPELQARVEEKRKLRDGLQEERVQFEELLDFAFEVLSNSSVMWTNSDLERRLALQQAIFPGGLTYDAEKGFGTPGMSRHFDALSFFKEPELTVAEVRSEESPVCPDGPGGYRFSRSHAHPRVLRLLLTHR